MPSVIAALVMSFMLTSCGGAFACPAIGWSNTLIVEVHEEDVAATMVEVCDERGCSSEPSPDGLTGFSPPQRTSEGWVFDLPDMSTPDDFIVRALDAEGNVIREVTVAAEWKRTGGSDQCGGPGEARVRLVL